MTNALRPSTLSTIGLGSVHDIFSKGSLPVDLGQMVDRVFGPAGNRGALVVSGANGIVGAGKTMQLGSRLQPFDVPIVTLDFPGVPDGIGRQYPGLQRAFGADGAAQIMANVVQLAYDGKDLPPALAGFSPSFLLEAVPEILQIKRAHYEVFRSAFPEIEIRSVTSGFPQSALGVGIAHPAFPHEINKIFEIVEPEPSAVTQLLWSMGLIPMAVSDNWSFVLDVLFCGLTQAAVAYHEASNMPFWKVDKVVRRLLGPNPFRAHDAIGAAGANFLTWSCLHHLAEHYGELFTPPGSLEQRKDSGQDWYPLNHFRPVVNWTLDGGGEEDFNTRILGPIFQMTSLMLHEKRSHLAQMNAIGEMCAQFSRGVLAVMRAAGPESVISTVETYHRLHPQAATSAWHPDAVAGMDSGEWQQLYVNAEHDGRVGVVSISRESYNGDVDAELNRAMDWLRSEGIEQLILSSDFHLSTQMTGADVRDFFPAMEDAEQGVLISRSWSETARRLHTDFKTTVGVVSGKRCLGGFLELLMHCHYLVAVEDAALGMPEVTLPVVPGMEGCHWPFRKTEPERWPRLFELLLEGRPVRGGDAVGWLVDISGSLEHCLQAAWKLACGEKLVDRRSVAEGPLQGVGEAIPTLHGAGFGEEGRSAIVDTVRAATEVSLGEALEVQAKHSGAFMTRRACRKGVIGGLYSKTMKV